MTILTRQRLYAKLIYMAKNIETIVISLGGSVIITDEIQIDFLKKFKALILKLLKKNYRFVIVTGGGKICRKYQAAAGKIAQINNEQKDKLGIQATRFNAFLIKTIFGKTAYPEILDNPYIKIKDSNYKIFLAAGWKPGSSTDYDALLQAKRFKAKKIINASNVDYIYDKDVNKFKTAKPFKNLTWQEYKKIIGGKWVAGLNLPFDPMAAKLAAKEKMTVFFVKATDLRSFENALTNKKFKGTIIS